MEAKLVEICPVCGGWGRFLSKQCSQCQGVGGKILKITRKTKNKFLEKQDNLSEQEKALFSSYEAGFSKKEIAENLDIAIFRIIPFLHSIEKKLNKIDEPIDNAEA